MTTSMITTNDPAGQMLALDTDPDTIHFSITYEHKRNGSGRSNKPWRLESMSRLANLTLTGWQNFATMEGAQWAALMYITEAQAIDAKPHEVHEWNTGRKYDHRGQLMQAVVIDKLRIAWRDHSRGIDGIAHVYEANNCETMSTYDIEREVMRAYDSDDFTYQKEREEFEALDRLIATS